MFFLPLLWMMQYFLMWHLWKTTKSTMTGFQCVFLQMLWMMQYSLIWFIQKSLYSAKIGFQSFFYWIVVNGGILSHQDRIVKFYFQFLWLMWHLLRWHTEKISCSTKVFKVFLFCYGWQKFLEGDIYNKAPLN